MTKDEIKKEVLGKYPQFIQKLSAVADNCESILLDFNQNHNDMIRSGDFRPGTFGRIISCIVTAKFMYDRVLNYIEGNKWDVHYLNTYIPKIYRRTNDLGHLRDIDTAIRHQLFHCIYHQIETTNRIIVRELSLSGGKPMDLVNKITNTFNTRFIDFIDAIRNTIHNNGYYQPVRKQEKEFSYNYKGKDFKFVEGEPIDITTDDILGICEDLLHSTYNTLIHPEILKIPITDDKS